MKSRRLYTISLGLIAISSGIIAWVILEDGAFLRNKAAMAIVGGLALLGYELIETIRGKKN